MALVRVNEHGRRIGETHRNARHSDADVERAIAAYEVLRSYAKVAAAVGAKKSTVRDWIKGNRRGQVGPRTSERDPVVMAVYRMPLSRRRAVLAVLSYKAFCLITRHSKADVQCRLIC